MLRLAKLLRLALSRLRKASRYSVDPCRPGVELLEDRAVPATSVVAVATNADAFVRGGTYASTNYGLTGQLVVKNDPQASNDRESFLRFDVSGVNGEIVSATLKLVPKSFGADARSTTYRVSLLADSQDNWVEGNGGTNNNPAREITWNNRPLASNPAVTFAGAALVAGQRVGIDVTALVASSANANRVTSFRIDAPYTVGTKRDVTFYSRQAGTAYQPLLELVVRTPNAAPVAGSDSAVTAQDTPVTIGVLANDSDADGDSLTLVGASSASHGTVVPNADGTLTYTPAAGYSGPDSFAYTISDGQAQATGTVSVQVQAPSASASLWPQRVFAPYVDATNWPPFDFVQTARNTGLRFFNLAFIVADTQNQPSWGGYYSVASGYRGAEIEELRRLGGDVMLSFGGAANTELAVALTDVNTLTTAYQSVIDTYALTHIDFDIEGAWVANRPSIDRRSQAIRNLQMTAAAGGKELEVWYTLPVLPSGLTPDGVYVLQSALNHGVAISGVNIMAMDYGDGAAPNPEGQMGEYAIEAATSLFNQLKTLYVGAGLPRTDAQLWHMVGVTPMIGQNDVPTERFYQQDARELLAFAQEKGLGMLAMWSANRDNSSGPVGQLSPSHSGVTQTAFEFSSIFNAFTDDSGLPPLPPPDEPPPPPPPPGGGGGGTASDQVRFQATSQWDSGFIGQMTITNTSSQNWIGWTLEFDSPFTITDIWSAEIVSRNGSRYVIRPADWTRSIAAGGSVTFGFQATPGNPAAPTNFLLTPLL